MSRSDGFVLAVDAGGTSTRVGCFSLDGRLLARATGAGGAPNHNHDARATVRRTIVEALRDGGLAVWDCRALAAGIAGISQTGSNQGTGDNSWTGQFIDISGLDCPMAMVNDAVIAHRGALGGRAGVIVVAGTGSMIMAITEAGEQIESGHFQHYAGGARHLVYDVVERLLTAHRFPVEDPAARLVLVHWDADDDHELRRRLLTGRDDDRNDRKRRFGALAPAITAVADHSAVADAALRGLVSKTAQGVRLLSPLITRSPTPVAVTGSLATSEAFDRRLREELSADDGRIALEAAALDPVGGAAIVALELTGRPVGRDVVDRLAGR